MGFVETGPGTFDDDHVQLSGGDQYRYTYTITEAYDGGVPAPLAVGRLMEFEFNLFLDGARVHGRTTTAPPTCTRWAWADSCRGRPWATSPTHL